MSFAAIITVGYGFSVERTKETLEWLLTEQGKRGCEVTVEDDIEFLYLDEWLDFTLFPEVRIDEFNSEGTSERFLTFFLAKSVITTYGKEMIGLSPTVLSIGQDAEEELIQLRILADAFSVGKIGAEDTTRFNWVISKVIG